MCNVNGYDTLARLRCGTKCTVLNLEWYYHLLHKFDPVVTLSGMGAILSKLKK